MKESETLGHQTGYEDARVVPDYGNGRVRALIEFYCQECAHYTYLRINLKLQGNHIINCPNCGHQHYRVVSGGIITSARFREDLPIAAQICVPKSACVPRENRRQRGRIAMLDEMEAVGLLK